MTVFAPLKLARQGLTCGETISPAQLGRTLCTEVAEQVPYWVAVLTPAERPLLEPRSTPECGQHVARTSVTLPLPTGSQPRRVLLLAALGAAVCTWQRNNLRSSSAGVLVDLDLDTGAVHPVRLPAVHTDTLAVPSHSKNLIDDVARRLSSVPNDGRDYELTRNYPALASRAGAQIIVRDDATSEPSRDYAIDIGITVTDAGTTVATITWAEQLQRIDELIQLWSAAVCTLVSASVASPNSVANATNSAIDATDSSAA